MSGHVSDEEHFKYEGMAERLEQWADYDENLLLPIAVRKFIKVYAPSENTRNPAAKFLAGLEQRCVSLKEGYIHPRGWLDSGHLQTMYGIANASTQAKLFSKCLQEHRCLEVLMTLEHYWDGAFRDSVASAGVFQSRYAYRLHVDVYPPTLDDDVPVPTLLLVGTDAGSSLGPGHRHYLEQQQRDLMRVAYEKKGWRTVSIQQVCALPPAHISTAEYAAPQNKWKDSVKEGLSSCGRCRREVGGGPEACGISSRDLRVAVEWLAMRFPDSKMLGVGFFLGANSLAKYLGEVGGNTPLVGAISLANPFSIAKLHRHLHTQSDSPVARNLYSSAIHLCHKAEYLVRFASHQYQLWGQLRRVLLGQEPIPRALEDVPSHAPQERVETLSCASVVGGIRVPMLLLHSQDDPFIPTDAVPLQAIQESPHLLLVESETGGHLAWYQSGEKAKDNGLPQLLSDPCSPTPNLPLLSSLGLSGTSFYEATPHHKVDQWSHQVILDFATLTFNKFAKSSYLATD